MIHAMSDEGDWYVLVERPEHGYGEALELLPPIHVPEGRAKAIEVALEFCRTKGATKREDGKRSSRQIFRLGETSWLVAAQTPHVSFDKKSVHTRKIHLRVHVGQLIEGIEGPPMEIPKRKGLFGRG